MFYGFHLLLNQEEMKNHKLSSNVIQVIENQCIESSFFPNTLIYQNNQDRNVILATDRDFIQPIPEQNWLFHVENVISFTWQTQGGKISYCFLEEATEEIFRFWLYHLVLPIYFSISNTYKFLHAGSVEINRKTVLFMAPSHGGKSTLTDYFIQHGHLLVTDDKMATFEKGGDFYAVPSHPYHRPYRQVEVLGHRCENAATEIRSIHAIYILEKDEPDSICTLRPLKGIEKFSRLHEGGEMNFSFFTKDYVQYLSRLANKVNVFNVKVPQDLDRLHEVYDIIVNHCESIKEEI